MVARTACLLSHDAIEAERRKVERINEGIDYTCGIVLAHVVVTSLAEALTSNAPLDSGRVRQPSPCLGRPRICRHCFAGLVNWEWKAATRAAPSRMTLALSVSASPAGTPSTFTSGLDQMGRRWQPSQLSA